MFSKKATKFDEIFTFDLTFHTTLIALPNDRYDLKKSDPHI